MLSDFWCSMEKSVVLSMAAEGGFCEKNRGVGRYLFGVHEYLFTASDEKADVKGTPRMLKN